MEVDKSLLIPAMDVDQGLLLERSEEQLVDSLLESSEEYLLDILNSDPHPSNLTLALLAEAAYEEKKKKETDQAYGKRLVLPEGWWLLTTASNTDFLNKYFGAAFIHTGSQQVVVAHRGTIPTKVGALYTDVKGVLFNKYTSCMNSSVTFVDYVRRVIHNVNSKSQKAKRRYNLTITGHSLGGWLAQATTFTVKHVKVSNGVLIHNTSDGLHAKAVVFDSPGAKDMLHKLQDKHYPRYGTKFLDRLDRLDITVYVSAPNRINTCGPHLRTVYRVLIDLSKYKPKDLDSVLYNVKTHGIGNFVEAFKENSPNIREVLDWAKGSDEYKSLFKHQTLTQANDFHIESKKKDIYFEKIKKRYQVIPSEPQVNFTSNLNAFSEDEVQILDYLVIILKQSEITFLNEFLLKEKLDIKSGKLFADFEINHKTRTICCESKQLLEELSARVKQLMRWLGPEFSEAVEKQSRTTDLIYRKEGRTYLNSVQKTRSDFTDSIGLRDFLLSKERAFFIVTQDVSFEMTRLHNIVLSQNKTNTQSIDTLNQYTTEGYYTFLDWPRLQILFNTYGSPVDQNNLMIVDASSSPTISSELQSFLNNYPQNSSPNLKKLVIILSHPIDTINVKTFNANRKINLMDLSDESQKNIINRKMINFTGNKKLSYREIMGENCSLSEFNDVISSNCLKSIVTEENYVFKIKDTRPTISDQTPSIKTNIKTSKEHLKCVDLPDSLIVVSGLNSEDLETGAAWEHFKEKIILAEGDAELFFKNTCDKNKDKTIYLLEVSGDAKADVRCKQIFNRKLYVSRKFQHRASINLKEFAESKHADDLFVVCSDEHKTLLLELSEKCKERETFKENILIANTKEQEVEIITNYFRKNIHFIKLIQVDNIEEQNDSDSIVEWRYSHGSVEGLRPCMSTEFLAPIDELSLSKTERNLVVITDEPGMGKTTSLARLSGLLEAPWVIHIELNQCKKYIDSLPDQLTAQKVATFILSASCSNSDSTLTLAHGLLLYFINSKVCYKRVILMVDGFDEIEDYNKNKNSSKNKIVQLVNFLQSKPTIEVFLTAREYLKESLEKNLSQFSTTFVKINAQEREVFLFRSWCSFLPLELREYGEKEKTQLMKYVREVLRQAEEVLGPDVNFMGIPLKLRMLAEVFRPQSGLLGQSSEGVLNQIKIESTSNLYKKFISLKYEIYLNDKTSLGAAADELTIKINTDIIALMHCKLGFKTFFPDFYVKHFDAIEEEWLNKLNRVGLIQAKGEGEFHFVHRTYAEYLCAQMVVHWLNQRTLHCRYELFKEILFPQILLHPDSKIIRMFINALLNETPISEKALELNSKCIIQLWNEDSSIFRNEEYQTVLHIAIIENNVYVTTLLLTALNIESAQEAFVSLIKQYDLQNNTAINCLRKPDLCDDELLLNTMITNILKCIETCSDDNKAKIFFAILFNPNNPNLDINVDKFLSFKRKFYLHDNTNSFFTRTIIEELEPIIIIALFYPFITNYFSCTSKVIERIKKVESLIYPFIEAISDNNTELLKNILFEKLKNNVERYCFLLIHHYGRNMQTALHLAVRRGHLDIVRLLLDQSADTSKRLLAQRDSCGRTPLLVAARRGSLSIIVKYLVESGADINAHCGEGESVLMYAAWHGELETVKYLVQRGADIHYTGRDGQTVLHRAASRGHLPLVEYFLQKEVDPHKVDRGGRTALSEASRSGKLDIVQLLLERGADINADGGAGLSVAIEWDRWSVVDTLINKGAAIKECQIRQNLSIFRAKYPNYKFKKE